MGVSRQPGPSKRQTSNAKLQTPNFKRQTSNAKLQTLNAKRRVRRRAVLWRLAFEPEKRSETMKSTKGMK
jgi:hypothetical protein